jgi:hypothetical protein
MSVDRIGRSLRKRVGVEQAGQNSEGDPDIGSVLFHHCTSSRLGGSHADQGFA